MNNNKNKLNSKISWQKVIFAKYTIKSDKFHGV